MWHTPTELFKVFLFLILKPYFGYAIANYILIQFKKLYSKGYTDELIIYEIGAGNGTLMLNILDYIRENEPVIYKKTQYRIIEISSKLLERQMKSVLLLNLQKAHRNIHLINQSVFDWKQKETKPCFVIAMEVIVFQLFISG